MPNDKKPNTDPDTMTWGDWLDVSFPRKDPPQTVHGSAYPHEGGCAGCRNEGRCNYCGVASIKYYHDRCTNGRCIPCHRDHCAPGGDTSPGHGYGV